MGSVSVEEAQRLTVAPRKAKKSVVKAFPHLASEEVRSTLQRDPVWNAMHGAAASIAKKLPGTVQNWLRGSGRANGAIRRNVAQPTVDIRLISQQLRNVGFSYQQAQDALGYEPVVESDGSALAFCRWYRSHFGLETEFSDLLEMIG